MTAHDGAQPPPPPRPPGGLAIVGGCIVDAGQGRHRAATVLVDGGEIAAVTPPSAEPDPDRTVVDATGLFLIPGLWDMHSHYLTHDDAHVSMPLMLANGVTGVRDMCSDIYPGERTRSPALEQFALWREDVAAGVVAGPRLVALSSFYLDGPEPVPAGAPAFARAQTPDQARAAVRYFRARGVDFAKVYNRIPRAAYFALADAARDDGLPFAGHKPWEVSTQEAAAAGQASVEHIHGVLWDCVRPDAQLGPHRAMTAALRRRAIAAHDPDALARVCEALSRHETRFVPTHVTRWFDVRAVREDLAADARLRYVPPGLRADWDDDAAAIRAANPEPADADALERWYELGLAFTAAAQRAGVAILAGSDANDSYIFPGFSLHEELAQLVRAGLSPAAALRAATSEPARALGLADRHGHIAAGRAADVVLLRSDPLARIENTRAIAAVVHDGRLYDRARLDAMLHRVAIRVAQRGGP